MKEEQQTLSQIIQLFILIQFKCSRSLFLWFKKLHKIYRFRDRLKKWFAPRILLLFKFKLVFIEFLYENVQRIKKNLIKCVDNLNTTIHSQPILLFRL